MKAAASASARRTVLKRGVLTAAAAAVATMAGSGEGRAAVPDVGGGQRLRLLGRGWHADVRAAPAKGQSFGVYGELLDEAGAKVGEFYGAVVAIDSPFQLTGEGVGTLEIHTLQLRAGSLIGIGAGSGAERSFAVVGGTGAYSGARGSYIAVQDTRGLGGAGSATFDIRLTA